MSTIVGTDIFLIARGTTNYQVSAADVAAFTGGGGAGVASFSAGTTGFTPVAATTGAVTLAGSLNIANGGTGATTSAAALTNLLPTQGGNAGKVLGTDGTTASWIPAGSGTVTSVTGTAPIAVATGTTTPVISISAATTAAAGSVQLATAAEAATGTDATKALTPATGVPKTPADMGGAALLPGGGDGGRPGTPAIGMLRYNNQGGIPGVLEFYDGSGWVTVSTGGFMGNVIYGSANLFATTSPLTITHASVSVANSYILLNTGVRVTVAASNGSAPVGAWISARTATSFTVTWKDNGVTPDQTMSYQIVY